MNGGMDMKGRRNGNMRTMSMDNILGDPFALATVSIAMVCHGFLAAREWGSLADNQCDSLLG